MQDIEASAGLTAAITRRPENALALRLGAILVPSHWRFRFLVYFLGLR